MSGRELPVILALGASQTLAWASSVYLPAILADPIAHDLKVSANWMIERRLPGVYLSLLFLLYKPRRVDKRGGGPRTPFTTRPLGGIDPG